jgi:hypothetical protein
VIYNLRIMAVGYGPGLELSKADYEALVLAAQRTYLATDVEEKLDLLLENYVEYERELLDLALESSLFSPLDDHRVFTTAQRINRRAINLLSAARTYIDQVKHSVSRYFGRGDGPDISALLSAEYDKHLEYRLAEELRNHAQHRALPVHRVSWPSSWEQMNAPDQRLRFSVIPEVSVRELVSEGGFKAKVLEELKRDGKEHVPLTPILRRYVESLASVHAFVRAAISGPAETDNQTVSAALERARAELSSELAGLAVTVGDDPENVHETHYLSDRSWVRRATLIRKNSQLSNLSRRYVSAEHAGDAA